MKNTQIGIVAMVALLLFVGCSSNKIGSLDNRWSKDTCGCSRIRDTKLADKLLKDYQLMNNTKVAFLNVFGEPDTIKESDGSEVLVYYWGTVCSNNKIIKESDRCYADFYFKDDKLISNSFPCE
ncbi:MAG: hypothetical protein ABIN91_05975 [Mucilaginibacter sp.]|uniref:hypothetical protein n=1 Tax=Mucilaginibacter sp. TaxID=1882438 RepID=UPI003267B320